MKKIKVPEAELLPSGAYRCRVMVCGISKTFTGDNPDAIEDLALKFKIGVLKESQDAKARGQTLGALIDEYIDFIQGPTTSPTTTLNYQSYRKNHFQSLTVLGLADLSDTVCQKAINAEAKKFAPKTVLNCWALITAALNYKELRIPKVRLPQLVQDEKPFLQPEEIPVFLKAAEGDKLEIPILLALHSLRRSEVLGMRWSSIDMKKKIIHVRGATVRGKNGLENKSTNKNTSSRRDVPIFIDRLCDLVKAADTSAEFVYTGGENTLCRHINRICKAAGLPEVGTHGLRHSFCSLCVHKRIPEKIVMSIGGWSDPKTMKRIYTHITKTDYADTVATLRASILS